MVIFSQLSSHGLRAWPCVEPIDWCLAVGWWTRGGDTGTSGFSWALHWYWLLRLYLLKFMNKRAYELTVWVKYRFFMLPVIGCLIVAIIEVTTNHKRVPAESSSSSLLPIHWSIKQASCHWHELIAAITDRLSYQNSFRELGWAKLWLCSLWCDLIVHVKNPSNVFYWKIHLTIRIRCWVFSFKHIH